MRLAQLLASVRFGTLGLDVMPRLVPTTHTLLPSCSGQNFPAERTDANAGLVASGQGEAARLDACCEVYHESLGFTELPQPATTWQRRIIMPQRRRISHTPRTIPSTTHNLTGYCACAGEALDASELDAETVLRCTPRYCLVIGAPLCSENTLLRMRAPRWKSANAPQNAMVCTWRRLIDASYRTRTDLQGSQAICGCMSSLELMIAWATRHFVLQ